jgi:Spy/CpxP family protein refolding chaperone
MGAGHIGPRMLTGLKEELALSEEQLGQLEKIHEDHHALMQAQMQNMRDLQESLREARSERDWDTLNQKIDEAANLRTGMAKGLVNVEKLSWEVLNDDQREKYATWQEGARLFQRQRMRGRREMGQQGMGMQRHLRIHADTAQSR